MIGRAFELYFSKNSRLQFITGLTSISALACSVAAELVIRSERGHGYVWSSIPALSNNSPAQSSEILVPHPG
jgi:hypothetical protein